MLPFLRLSFRPLGRPDSRCKGVGRRSRAAGVAMSSRGSWLSLAPALLRDAVGVRTCDAAWPDAELSLLSVIDIAGACGSCLPESGCMRDSVLRDRPRRGIVYTWNSLLRQRLMWMECDRQWSEKGRHGRRVVNRRLTRGERECVRDVTNAVLVVSQQLRKEPALCDRGKTTAVLLLLHRNGCHSNVAP